MIINIIIHLVCANNLEYHRDELLYFSLGDHLSAGYYSVPPLIAWIARFIKICFGHSVLAVKIFPALLSGLLIYLATLITKELGGKRYAILTTSLGILLMPVGLRAFHLFQPVPLDLFFWTLIIYLTIKYFTEKKNSILLVLGFTVGIALLNKYLIALLIVSLLIALSLSNQRVVFKKLHLYFAFLISLVVFLPNLIWQFNHGFPVISHMSELNSTQLVNVNRLRFLSDQLMMAFGFSIYIVIGLIYLLSVPRYRYLGFTSVFVVFILLLLRGKSYYTIGLFPLLLSAGSVWMEKKIASSAIKTAILAFVVLISLPIIPLGIPIFKQSGMAKYFSTLENKLGINIGRRWEDGQTRSLPQDYADQLGWEELVQKIAVTYNTIPDKSKTLIYAENYGQAGAIQVIGRSYGLPFPVSFDESFIYWVPESFNPDIEQFIYVNDELGEDVAELFESTIKQGEITNPNARENGTSIYLCTRPKSSFNEFWKIVLESR